MPVTKADVQAAQADAAAWKKKYDELALICYVALGQPAVDKAFDDAKAEGASWKGKYDELVAAIVKAWQDATKPPPPPPPPPSGTIVGMCANGHNGSTAMLGTNVLSVVPFKHVRFNCDSNRDVNEVAGWCDQWLAKGVMPLVVPAWDGTDGSGGQVAWAGKLAAAVKGKCSAIEWGNEDYFKGWNMDAYAKSALGACKAAAPYGVKVLPQGGGGSYWAEVIPQLCSRQPELKQVAGGWTVHLYWDTPTHGSQTEYEWAIDHVQAQLVGHKNPHQWLTEFGFASDDNRTGVDMQPDNYGHDRKLTYQGAADLLNQWWPRLKNKVYAAYIFQGFDNAARGQNPPQREAYFGTSAWSGSFWGSPITAKGAYTDAVKKMISEGR